MCQLGPSRSSRVSARAPAASRRRASRSARRRRAQSTGDGRVVSMSVDEGRGRSIAGGALTGTGKAGRGKTVTSTSGKRSLRALYSLRYVLDPTRKQDTEVKERRVSGDECHIHARCLLADGAW